MALLSLPSPLILLGLDARWWRTDPALPPVPRSSWRRRTPSLARRRSGSDSSRSSSVRRGARGWARRLGPAAVVGRCHLHIGVDGSAPAVFRSWPSLVAVSAARIAALGLRRGAGILMGVSLASGQAVNHLVGSLLLGGPLGLLEPLDHRAALDALARPEFHCWRGHASLRRRAGPLFPHRPQSRPRSASSPRPSRGRSGYVRRWIGVPMRQTCCVLGDRVSLPWNARAAAACGVPEQARRRRPRCRASKSPSATSVRVAAGPSQTGRVSVRSPCRSPDTDSAHRRQGGVDGWSPRGLGSLEADEFALAGQRSSCCRISRPSRRSRRVAAVTVAAGA